MVEDEMDKIIRKGPHQLKGVSQGKGGRVSMRI